MPRERDPLRLHVALIGIGAALLGALLGLVLAGILLVPANADTSVPAWTAWAGSPNGIATLDASGRLPVAQLGGGAAGTSTFLRGDQTWATPAGGGGPAYVRKTADQSNNLITLADVADLALAVPAPGTYSFRFELYFTAAATTTGLGLSVNGPAQSFLRFGADISTSATARLNGVQTTYGGTVLGTASGAATPLVARLTGTVTTTAAGTLQLRFRSEVATSNVTILRGSWGELAP